MELTEDKIILLKLVESASFLDEQNKLLLQKQIDGLTTEQIKKLTKAFKEAKERLNNIENDFNAKALPLKTQYLEIIEEFKQKGLKTALQKWEKADEADKDKELKTLIDSLDNMDSPSGT